MSTILFASPVFGPIQSRRLGASLGINLLPETGKVCTFDCIYCECGLNAQTKTSQKLPSPHPHFAEIVDDVIKLRNRYYPDAKISVLTNGTQVHKEAVFSALMRVDNNILKLDTVDEDYIALVDRPTSHYSVHSQIEAFAQFKGHAIIQTMFLKGTDADGHDVANVSDHFVLPWIEALKIIQPEEVMVYTIDRETPESGLMKASVQELDRIGELVKEAGLAVQVSY